MVSVEQDASGRFQKCTALALVNAGVDRVWQVVTDWGDYEKFMPKVVHSRVIKQEGNIAVVKYELEVPGVNTKYTMRQEMHPDTHTVVSTWVEGDLQGTAWTFRVEPAPDGKTLLSYSGSSRHFSRILESLEDDQQTISVGVNVSAALTTVKALKKRAESH